MRTQFSFRERKRFLTIFFMVMVALFLCLLFAPKGVIRYLRLRQEIKELNAEVVLLQTQNSELAEEIHRLKNDPAYLEKVVREEYGWIRKNEMIFDLGRPSKKH